MHVHEYLGHGQLLDADLNLVVQCLRREELIAASQFFDCMVRDNLLTQVTADAAIDLLILAVVLGLFDVAASLIIVHDEVLVLS